MNEVKNACFLSVRLPWVVAVILVCAGATGCRDAVVPTPKPAEIAEKMFDERCKNAGERIYKSVSNVEGIFLINIRPTKRNLGNQYAMDDPYGADFGGDAYIGSFLQGFYDTRAGIKKDEAPYPAFQYAEAIDPADGKRYRYTGGIEEPALTDSKFLSGYIRFKLDRVPAPGDRPRYGVQFTDISTREDRDYWIAGSSLKVIDLETGTVIAERVGYMWDQGQGSTDGFRSPWLFATDTACPNFGSAVAQIRQTEIFVKKSLIPRTKDASK